MTVGLKLRFTAIALVLSASILAYGPAPAMGAPASTYYVDCAGNDANKGTSPAQAWLTLARANKAVLGPAQQLRLRSGCIWDQQTLDASWSGQPGAPVKIGPYGTGAKPVITNGKSEEVEVTGAYLEITGISVSFSPTTFSTCGEPLGTHYGFNVLAGAHDDTIQNSIASNETAGIKVSQGANNNHLLRNLLTGNNMVNDFHANPALDLGAWGMLIGGDSNEIAFNRLQDNIAVCSNQGYKPASNSIELFAARGNFIHNNVSLRDRVFSELGSSSTIQSSDNEYAYNLFASQAADSRFIVTRGALDTQFGPVYNTLVDHNSIYQSDPTSIGIICGRGCGPDILITDSNIVWAEGKVVFSDASFTNLNDIFWNTIGKPDIEGLSPDASAQIANPRWVNAPLNNLRLRANSPAIGKGNIVGSWTVDVYNKPLPAGPGVDDAGAAQFS